MRACSSPALRLQDHLDEQSQQSLLAALLTRQKHSVSGLDEAYLQSLFAAADSTPPHGLLQKCVAWAEHLRVWTH